MNIKKIQNFILKSFSYIITFILGIIFGYIWAYKALIVYIK